MRLEMSAVDSLNPSSGLSRVINGVPQANCARSSTDGASDYGSEGLGFESLRARKRYLLIASVDQSAQKTKSG